MNKQQPGFAVIESLLILVIVAIIGFGGYYVWNSQKQTNKTLDAANSTSQNSSSRVTKSENLKKLSLANGAVDLKYSNLWTAGTSSYDPTGEQQCVGKPVTSSELCIDNVTLQLSKEGITDTDHFHVIVNVYKRSNRDSLKDWFNNDLGLPNGEQMSNKDITINGHPAVFFEGDYGKDEARVYYASTTSNYGVTLSSTFFRGQYYSFKNSDNIDYFKYRSDVEALAKTIEINQ